MDAEGWDSDDLSRNPPRTFPIVEPQKRSHVTSPGQYRNDSTKTSRIDSRVASVRTISYLADHTVIQANHKNPFAPEHRTESNVFADELSPFSHSVKWSYGS